MSATASSRLPAPKEVRDLLAALLGREVSLRPPGSPSPSAINPASAGTYVDPTLRVVGGIVLDLSLSARIGAAAGHMPPLTALDSVERGRLSPGLRAGVQLVLEGAAPLFEGSAAPRVRLHATHHAGDPVPSPALAQALAPPRRRDLWVQVAGHGAGRLTVAVG